MDVHMLDFSCYPPKWHCLYKLSGVREEPEPRYEWFFQGIFLSMIFRSEQCGLSHLSWAFSYKKYLTAKSHLLFPRYRHELALWQNKLYVLGGGTSFSADRFEDLPTFDISQKKWYYTRTKSDPTATIDNVSKLTLATFSTLKIP